MVSPSRFVACLALVGSLATAVAQVEVVGPLARTLEATPGTVVEGTLRLRNAGDRPASAELYLEDLVFDGTEDRLAEPATHPRSNAGWITLGAETVELAPDEVREVPFRVAVPDDPQRVGAYWSTIMVENRLPPPADDTEGAFRIRATTRYQVLVATELPGGAQEPLAFENPRLERDGEGLWFRVEVANPGEVVFEATTYVEAYDAEGTHVATIDGRRGRIFPGAASTRSFDLGGLPGGTYSVLVVADGGAAGAFGARYELDVPAR